MELTTAVLERYIGGDFEVQNKSTNWLARGPVKAARIEDDMLTLEFDWFANNDGGPLNPASGWTASNVPSYEVKLSTSTVSEIQSGRLCISPFNGEVGVLFPLGGSQLDQAKVAGLPADQAASSQA